MGRSLSGLGEVHLKQGDLEGAARAYKKAIRLNSKSASAMLGLGKTYTKQGRLDAAITAVKKAIEIQVDHTEAHYQLAQIYVKRGETEKAATAMTFFKVLRQTDPLLEKPKCGSKSTRMTQEAITISVSFTSRVADFRMQWQPINRLSRSTPI